MVVILFYTLVSGITLWLGMKIKRKSKITGWLTLLSVWLMWLTLAINFLSWRVHISYLLMLWGMGGRRQYHQMKWYKFKLSSQGKFQKDPLFCCLPIRSTSKPIMSNPYDKFNGHQPIKDCPSAKEQAHIWYYGKSSLRKSSFEGIQVVSEVKDIQKSC